MKMKTDKLLTTPEGMIEVQRRMAAVGLTDEDWPCAGCGLTLEEHFYDRGPDAGTYCSDGYGYTFEPREDLDWLRDVEAEHV